VTTSAAEATQTASITQSAKELTVM
jgi:hypothetical protein